MRTTRADGARTEDIGLLEDGRHVAIADKDERRNLQLFETQQRRHGRLLNQLRTSPFDVF